MAEVQFRNTFGQPSIKETSQSEPAKKAPKRGFPPQMPHACDGQLHNLFISKDLPGNMLGQYKQFSRLPNLIVNALLVQMRRHVPLRHRNGGNLAEKIVDRLWCGFMKQFPGQLSAPLTPRLVRHENVPLEITHWH